MADPVSSWPFLKWSVGEEVRFDRFMRACLYDPEHGYYRGARKAVGKDGDFVTSPHLSTLFGRLLGRAIIHYDRELSSPRPLDLIELGADQGLLGEQLGRFLREEAPDLWDRARYVPIDAGDSIPEEIRGIVFSNEFFDALPVRRIAWLDSRLQEIWVRLAENGTLHEVLHETDDEAARGYLSSYGSEVRDGWIYEVNLQLPRVLEELNLKTRAAVVISFDYGYLRDEYHELDRPDGTLLCYSGHQVHSNPYQAPGGDDITAHIDFDLMIETGNRLGWTSEPVCSQRQFLERWGLFAELAAEEERGLLRADRLGSRLGIRELIKPGGISDILRVLVQRIPKRGPRSGTAASL